MKNIIIPNQFAWGIIALSCIAFFMFGFGIESAVFALLGILVLWWTFEYPEESFLTLIVLSPLLPLLKATQILGHITLVKDVIIITLFLRNFLFPLLTQKLPYRRNALFAPIVALVGWACFEVLRAGVTTLSILRLRDIVLYILLYFGVLYLPHTVARMKVRLTTFLATLIVTMVLGFYQFIYAPDSTVLRFDPARQIWIPRIASTFAHPTVFAEYLITGFVFVLGILLTKIKKFPLKAYIGELFLLCTTVLLLYFTYTRAAWIGFIAAIVTIGIAYFLTTQRVHSHLLGGRWKGWIMGVFGALIVFFMLVGIFNFTPVGTFVRSAFDIRYASNADRIVFIVQLISQTSNTDAIIGKGLGNTITKMREGGNANAFDIVSGESRTVQLSKDQTLVDNQYLKTFVEMGVVGIVLTFWLFWRFFLASKKALNQKNASHFALGLASLGFLAAFIVQALFVDIWDVFPTNAIFWTVAALVSQVKYQDT